MEVRDPTTNFSRGSARCVVDRAPALASKLLLLDKKSANLTFSPFPALAQQNAGASTHLQALLRLDERRALAMLL